MGSSVVAYYEVRGEGPPLVLIHGIGAGNSSYEWRHNFDPLSDHFRVFALDLPGFGQSARPNINYTDDLYILALMDFLRDVVRQPAALIASSLSGSFAVKFAAAHPEALERLVLVCPTGLRQLRLRTPIWSQMVYGTFSLPVLGLTFYNAMLSYNRVDDYLRRNLYADPTLVTPALAEHYYVSAHQPGAQYALRSFLAGLLNCDITAVYPTLQQPILIAWGAQAQLSPVENAKRFQEMNANARLRVFENSGLLPHDEEAEAFNAEAIAFLTGQNAEAVYLPPIQSPSSPQRFGDPPPSLKGRG